ncbi:hypothetical protein EPO15_07610 [bacterium]|nr:MAG: hypothetical protein EPO15_07610 [bacterium]
MADSLAGGKGLPQGEAEAISRAAVREAARRTRTTLPPGRPAADAARKRLPQGAPDGAPKHRVRRVAVLYAPGRDAEAADLWAALHDIGKTIRVPVYLRAVLLEPVHDGAAATQLAGKAGVGGAIAALAVVDAPLAPRFAEAFEKRRVKLLTVPADKVHDRATLVDMMSELLVLDPVAFAGDFAWGEGFDA